MTDEVVPKVMEADAKMVPLKKLAEPKVALEPTPQKTFLACAPFRSTKEVVAPVMRVLAAWNIQTASESPSASRVTARLAAILRVPGAVQYTPGVKVRPPSSDVVSLLAGGQVACMAAV